MKDSVQEGFMQESLARILVVDDEPQVCSLIRQQLLELGLESCAVTESRQAEELLSTRRFELVIADVRMPDIDGMQLLTHARQQVPGCKVVMITGGSTQQYLTQALALGAYDYIEKPINAEEFAALIGRALKAEDGISELSVRAAEAIRLSNQSRQTAFDSVRSLVHTVEAKDPHTREHSEHVALYATSLATDMDLPATDVESIRVASLLHDIGKIGVPDHVLTKPGPLTEEEFELIRRHPTLGADILSHMAVFEQEARIIRYHHEDWNGKGYPCNLAGERIPLGSRIIRVCDAMDAMLMERTYKTSYPVEHMLDELTRASGSQFDPSIARQAILWCRTTPDKLIVPVATTETVR